MGIKILIAEACLLAGEAVAAHADVGEIADVSKDDASTLCRMGRAYYLERADDPTKGTLTATKEIQDFVKKRAKTIAADQEERTAAAQAGTPAGMAAMVAAAVAQAVQAALVPATART